MTSDQDAKVVAEPQAQRVQEGKDSSHLVGAAGKEGGPRAQASISFSDKELYTELWLLEQVYRISLIEAKGLLTYPVFLAEIPTPRETYLFSSELAVMTGQTLLSLKAEAHLYKDGMIWCC